MSSKHPSDGKFVVVQGGQRISDLHESEQQAIAEADRLRKLAESQGAPKTESEPVKVVKNLYG